MKSSFLILAVALLSITACEKKEVPDSVTEVITSGSWRIGHYMDNSGDETSNFVGFSFQFQENGTLTALKNGVTQNGTWVLDNSSNKLIIDLGADVTTNQPLGELTDDWKIQTFNNTQISLYDDSNSSEMLVFQKN